MVPTATTIGEGGSIAVWFSWLVIDCHYNPVLSWLVICRYRTCCYIVGDKFHATLTSRLKATKAQPASIQWTAGNLYRTPISSNERGTLSRVKPPESIHQKAVATCDAATPYKTAPFRPVLSLSVKTTLCLYAVAPFCLFPMTLSLYMSMPLWEGHNIGEEGDREHEEVEA